MDLPRLALRASSLACAGLLVLLLAWSASHRGEALAQTPIRDLQGEPLAVPAAPTVQAGTWAGLPVLVFAVPAQQLAGVEAARGAGSATPSIGVPGHPELRLFALSAKSTHLGCTVGFNARLGASLDVGDYDGDGLLDGRLIDPCHLGQWDAFHRGVPVAGPAPSPLPSLDIRIVDGRMLATHFDGVVGPQRHL
ncbi:MAG: ubiquinol-cytochrome c reductase iron-sulfur subunit [Thermoplasmatota archaeon]